MSEHGKYSKFDWKIWFVGFFLFTILAPTRDKYIITLIISILLDFENLFRDDAKELIGLI